MGAIPRREEAAKNVSIGGLMTAVATPPVAVVTAAWNMERYIGDTIGSVLRQTLTDFEMILIDDGSSDATASIVKAVADPRIRLFSIRRAGVSAARNRGLDACHAPLVVFLDADDLLLPDALGRMVATMAAHPHHVACFGQHVKMREDGAPCSGSAPSRLKKLPTKDTLRYLLCGNLIVNGGALCIRTAAARDVGAYDTTLSFAEDWEFWCRLAALGDFVALQDFVAVQYRVRATGANTAMAGSPFRPNLQALDRIYNAPAVNERFDASELRRFRSLARSNLHWAAARNALAEGLLLRFGAYFIGGMCRHPASLLQWRLFRAFFRGAPFALPRS
jgi:glycosyltransferase involved in cell wall biosynthesis